MKEDPQATCKAKSWSFTVTETQACKGLVFMNYISYIYAKQVALAHTH